MLVLASLTACSTPYQKNGMTGGFTEVQLKDDIWRIKFGGNGYTTYETVQTYWLFRCSELAIEKGYDGFEILSNIPLASNLKQYLALQDGFHPVASYVPIYIPMDSGTRFPAIEGDIRLIKKPFESSPPKIFDATNLKSALEPLVKGDKCSVNQTAGNVCPHVHEYLFTKEQKERISI